MIASPSGYVLRDKYRANSRTKNLGSLILFVVSLCALLYLNLLFRPEFKAFEFARRVLLEGEVLTSLRITLIAVIAVAIIYVYGLVHEALHGGLFWIFTKRRPNFGRKGLNLYTTLPIGVYCTRNKTIVAALGPLIIITVLCFILWLMVPLDVVPAMILLISVNIAACISDILQFSWLLRFSGKSLFGFHGQDSVIYEPQDIGHE
jgi:hypothetical protein